MIVLLGWGAMEATLALRTRAAVDRMIRSVVPGDAELVLEEPGTYTIFHEYRSVVDGRAYSVSGVSGLLIDVRALPGGDELMLEGAPGLAYESGDEAGRSLFKFEIAKPGRFHLVTSYDDGRTEPRTVVTIAHDFVADRTMTRRIAETFAFGSIALAAVITLTVLRRRRVARPP